MKFLKMTVGLPRSGKSTWASASGHPVVNPDSIRLALHGQAFIGDAEPMVWAIAKYMVKALFLAGHDVVVLDATNTTKARRDEWKSRAWKREFVVFDIPADVCASRAERGGMQVLVPVIARMADAYESVGPDEIEV